MKNISIIFILFLSTLSYSQCVGGCTTVTGTVQDSSNQIWSNGSISASLVPRQGISIGSLRNQGNVITDGNQTSFLDGTGAFTFILDDNSKVTPDGSTWSFIVCPNASFQCSSFSMIISGINIDISSAINSTIKPLSVNSQYTITRTYSDTQAIGGNGALYFRTSDNTLRICQALPNQTCGGGGFGGWISGNGGTAANPTGSVQFNSGGIFGGDANFTWDNIAKNLLVKSATFAVGVTSLSYTSTAINGGFSGTEGTGVTVPAGGTLDVMWPDSTSHRWLMNNNGGGNQSLAGTLPSGNVTTAGTVISTGTCQAQTGITITGALTTDNVIANIGAVLPATWQTGIRLSAHVTTSNTVTVYLCNPTAGSITPVATQVNVRILR